MDIHNFCIIAHVDHGKSTLADRMLELTGTVEKRNMKEQLLDSMDLEREKGITIKLQPVRMQWPSSASTFAKAMADRKASAGEKAHIFNLIDTPGHVDFQYEVSRSLQAVEGAILLVDATQGVQAQTIANLYLALEQNLEIIPVINKIDLPAADVPRVTREIERLLGGAHEDIIAISAKTGEGVAAVLDAVAQRVPAAPMLTEQPLRALIFDSTYDDYKGVVVYVRIVEGEVAVRDELTFLGTGAHDHAVEVGTFAPGLVARKVLHAGEIGYIATGLKDVRQARVGDTISHVASRQQVTPLPGFHIPQPKVFAGIYPTGGDDFPRLREAISQLQLNDASLSATQERSTALGQGFRCGFLGMLHLEIIQERLRREHDLDLVVTTPSVEYRVRVTDGTTTTVQTPAQFPDPSAIEAIEEQYSTVEIVTPVQYMGAVFEIMQDRESKLLNQEHTDTDRVILEYSLPLRELVVDLYDQLKSVSSGYASLSYELTDWRECEVVKVSFLINQESVESLSVIVAAAKADKIGRRMVEKLKEVIPKQLFAIPIQATIGGKVIARETISALRKDVTSGLYGGDYSRKRKQLEKQKKGKKKMQGVGSVEIPPEAYIAVLKR